MRKSLIFLLILFFGNAQSIMAQQPDITGIWAGYLELTDSLGQPVRLPYEIAVSEEKGKMTGYSRITFHANGKDEVGMEQISLKWKGKELVIEDEGFVEHEFAVNPKRVKKTMNLKLTEDEKERTLEGEWTTNRTRQYRVPTKGTAVLKRNADFKTSALFRRLDTLKVAEKLSFTKQEVPTVAAVTPTVEKPVQAPPPPPAPVEEPELIIPAIGHNLGLTTIVLEKKPAKALVKIAPVSKGKKQQMDLLARNYLKPKPVPPAPKPAPDVAVVTPKPAPKPTPPAPPKPAPVAKNPPPAEEKKPVTVVKAPPPPPVAVVAPSVTKGAAEFAKRTTKTDKEVYFESDSLVLTLYDNGEVDGDTVTVLMNGNIVFSKAGLSTRANTKTVYTNIPGDSVSLVMYAETLGEIPPNTGLMIIMDGEKRYEVRFSADLKTNAAIILRRKRDE